MMKGKKKIFIENNIVNFMNSFKGRRSRYFCLLRVKSISSTHFLASRPLLYNVTCII